MKQLKDYTIQFVGLKLGKHTFDYKIEKTFFETYNFDEFNDVNVNVHLLFEKKSTLMELHFDIEGYVNVNCDVTNEPFNQDIVGKLNLVVKFGEDYNDDHDEILVIPHGEYEINVAQYIYELIILSVPTRRIHPGVEDGSLNSEILTRLKELSPKKQNKSDETDPRWDKLKNLLTDK